MKNRFLSFFLGVAFVVFMSGEYITPGVADNECVIQTRFYVEGVMEPFHVDKCRKYLLGTSVPLFIYGEEFECISWGDYYDQTGFHRDIVVRSKNSCK